MIDQGLRVVIEKLHKRGHGIREISRVLRVSRNTVRRVIRATERSMPPTPYDPHTEQILGELYARCNGNVVRLRELFISEYQREIPYSTLARWVRDAGLRPTPRRVGTYHFEPGEEMQHDTSPMRVTLGEHTVTAQCVAVILAYSRMLYMQFSPRFRRFEAKSFLADALIYLEGTPKRCVVDNTSVIVAGGSGANAIIAPEMEAFATAFATTFCAHRVRDPDRKGRIERPFHYIQNNFLVGRTFCHWDDLNQQALQWCNTVANHKVKRVLGMSPQAAHIIEKPMLQPLPKALPPIYENHARTVDVYGFVSLDTHRYSVPERWIGRRVSVLKFPRTVAVVVGENRIAEHTRLVGKPYQRSTIAGHHNTAGKRRSRHAPPAEEALLLGHHTVLDSYVKKLRERAPGRGVRKLQRLLALKREYPADAFIGALELALNYGMFDLQRLEQMIIARVCGDFFNFEDI